MRWSYAILKSLDNTKMIKFNSYKLHHAQKYVVPMIKHQLNITFSPKFTFGSPMLPSISHSLPLMPLFLKGPKKHAAQNCDPGEKGSTQCEPQDCSSFPT